MAQNQYPLKGGCAFNGGPLLAQLPDPLPRRLRETEQIAREKFNMPQMISAPLNPKKSSQTVPHTPS